MQDTHSNISGKPSKRRNTKSVKQKCAMREMEKPTFMQQPRPSTTGGRVQAYPGTDHTNAVTRRSHQGVGAPWVQPHPHRRLSGPCSSGGCMPPCIGGFGQFPILLVPNRPHSTIKEGVELSFNTHIIWSYTPHYHFLYFYFSSLL